jgi:hypothetical protein
MQSAAGREAARARGKMWWAKRGFGRGLRRPGGGPVTGAASLQCGVVNTFGIHNRDVKLRLDKRVVLCLIGKAPILC